jgi:hypothetical protein
MIGTSILFHQGSIVVFAGDEPCGRDEGQLLTWELASKITYPFYEITNEKSNKPQTSVSI